MHDHWPTIHNCAGTGYLAADHNVFPKWITPVALFNHRMALYKYSMINAWHRSRLVLCGIINEFLDLQKPKSNYESKGPHHFTEWEYWSWGTMVTRTLRPITNIYYHLHVGKFLDYSKDKMFNSTASVNVRMSCVIISANKAIHCYILCFALT